jgi:hypothetical protein
MTEEVEVETKDLQEAIEELHEERQEREEAEQRSQWTRYIALTTAILAVFAAIGALKSGALVNEAMIDQLRASDKWNEYQAARQKDHIYSLEANALLDRGARPPTQQEAGVSPASETDGHYGNAAKLAGGEAAGAAKRSWKPLSPDGRLAQYISKAEAEANKEERLSEEARDLEKDSHKQMESHERFALSVAMIQVAIALGAVSALTRMKVIWGGSMLVGGIGIVLFAAGFLVR